MARRVGKVNDKKNVPKPDFLGRFRVCHGEEQFHPLPG